MLQINVAGVVLACSVFFELFFPAPPHIFLLRHSDSSSLFSGPAVQYDGQTCQGVPSAPPMLGQHTTEILTDMLQYSDRKIYDLERDGVIQCDKNN